MEYIEAAEARDLTRHRTAARAELPDSESFGRVGEGAQVHRGSPAPRATERRFVGLDRLSERPDRHME